MALVTDPDAADRSIGLDGQQVDYVILSEEERAKGFVRPVRRTYVHEKCGKQTTMALHLAESFARKVDFYSGTFCCHCGGHFLIGIDGEFSWLNGDKVGT